MFRSILALLPLLPAALAHGGVIGYNIGGVYYKGFAAYNTPTYGSTTLNRPQCELM